MRTNAARDTTAPGWAGRRCRHNCRSLECDGSFRDGLCSRNVFGGVGQHLNLQVRGYFTVQLDGNIETAQALERLRELNLAAVHFKTLGFKRARDVGCRNGAEKLAVFARFARKAQ